MGYKNNKGVIRFSSRRRKNCEFANDAPWAIRLHGVTWPTVTHYLTAQRYPGQVWSVVRDTPLEDLPSLAQGERGLERCKWEAVRDDYLLRALTAKFTQHLDLEAKLVDTGQAQLVFADRTDRHLGIGPHGTGHNMLGRLLMVVRRRLDRPALSRTPTVQELQNLKELEDIAGKYPDNADKLSDLAIAYYDLGWYDRALSTSRMSMDADASHIWAYIVMARSLVRLDRYAEATVALKQLLRIDNSEPDYFRWLSQAYEKLDRRIPAILYERRARLLEEEQE